MPELSEKIQPVADDERKPVAKRSAEIIPIKGSVAETGEEIEKFSAYQALGGHLTRAEYDRIKKKTEEGNVEPNTQAQLYADHADLTLSPEVLTLYSVLRRDSDISSPLLRSDQPLLAEALRIAGQAADLQKFIDSYPEKNIEF